MIVDDEPIFSSALVVAPVFTFSRVKVIVFNKGSGFNGSIIKSTSQAEVGKKLNEKKYRPLKGAVNSWLIPL